MLRADNSCRLLGGLVLLGVGWSATGVAAELIMRDGRAIEGRLAQVASLAGVPQPHSSEGEGPVTLIVLTDDDLRRTFVPRWQIQTVLQDEASGARDEKFLIRQRPLRRGGTVQTVGPIASVTPFDEFGRRILQMNTRQGPVDVVQGITELTPRWAKVEGITHVWDMRIATSSIPSSTLHEILQKQIDPGSVDHQKQVARFYLQAERFAEARRALEAVLEAMPDEPDLRAQLDPSIRALRQMGAQRLLRELQLRREAGQHRLVHGRLESFPSDDVAGEILQAVRELIDEYAHIRQQGDAILAQIEALAAQVAEPQTRTNIQPVCDEIRAELSINTLARMAAFRQHADDDNLQPEQRLALAISGWLVGSDAATLNLPVALSLFRVRALVREFLNEPVLIHRQRLLAKFGSEEGASPRMVAAILRHMKPPGEVPEPVSATTPGLYAIEVAGLPGDPPVPYLVQTPPEYDPYRLYPTIVTLHGAATTAEHQVDWWAGAWTEGGWRAGQATRHGYIVVAPKWTKEHQKSYEYSAREHAAVLNALRDACRRFAIDTDRVYLSGHSMGGDAAWDLALAHPDLWAGAMPIVAKSDRYCRHYWPNAKYVPFYCVFGELDSAALLAHTAQDLDRYFRNNYNVTVVEYLGRGHEDFSDEIQRLFDWMGRFRRDFYPRQFECKSMRSFDSFFWWVELDGLPPGSQVDPVDWPPSRGARAATVEASVIATNGLRVSYRGAPVTVWISPELVDFEQRASIVVNGRRINSADGFLQPDLWTILEDARSRADRQHPFWAKIHSGP